MGFLGLLIDSAPLSEADFRRSLPVCCPDSTFRSEAGARSGVRHTPWSSWARPSEHESRGCHPQRDAESVRVLADGSEGVPEVVFRFPGGPAGSNPWISSPIWFVPRKVETEMSLQPVVSVLNSDAHEAGKGVTYPGDAFLGDAFDHGVAAAGLRAAFGPQTGHEAVG